MKKHAKLISSILALAAVITCMLSLMFVTANAEDAEGTATTTENKISMNMEIDPTGSYNLTELGSVDWMVAHSERNSNGVYYRKNINSPIIKHVACEGYMYNETKGRSFSFEWSDGDSSKPTAEGYVYYAWARYNPTSSFQYSVPVEAYNQTLTMFVGIYMGENEVQAYFESNPDEVFTVELSADAENSMYFGKATIDFSGKTGDNLIVTFKRVGFCSTWTDANNEWKCQSQIYALALNHEHTFEYVPAAERTCTADGVKAHYACACGALASDANGENVLTEADVTIPALGGHTEVVDNAKAPTCTETGLTEGKHCSVCNEVLVAQKTVDALGHTEVVDAAVPATCKEAGKTEGKHCSVCNKVLVAQEVVPATGAHVYAEEKEKVPATCETDGYVIKACGCGETNRETLTALGHDYEAVVTAPTCTEAGYTTYTCKNDKAHTYVSDNVVALGHTNSEAVKENEKTPDCTTAGSYDSVVYCSVCKAEVSRETITVDALGHTNATAVVENNVAPDCDTAGSYDNVVYCSVCGDELSRDTVSVPALGHTEAVDSAVAPTCTETGLTEGKHCSVCNEVLVAQEVVPALGHTEVVDEAVAPTCTKVGKTEGKHCSVCNEVLVAQTGVSALGHTEVVDEAVAPTCTEAGKTAGKHCSVCNEVLVAQGNIDALGHDFADATTEAPKTCKTCGATEGDKLPTPEEPEIPGEPEVPGSDEEPKDEQPEEDLNFFQKIWLAIVNFFKKLFGIK